MIRELIKELLELEKAYDRLGDQPLPPEIERERTGENAPLFKYLEERGWEKSWNELEAGQTAIKLCGFSNLWVVGVPTFEGNEIRLDRPGIQFSILWSNKLKNFNFQSKVTIKCSPRAVPKNKAQAQVLPVSSSKPVPGTIVAGSGIKVTNGNNVITTIDEITALTAEQQKTLIEGFSID